MTEKRLAVSGELLPTDSEVTIKFAGTECDTTTVTADGSNIECDLQFNPAGGVWDAFAFGTDGRVLLDSVLTQISIPIQVDSVTPNSDLNQNGGDILTFSGIGFPLNTNDISVTFSDGTSCTVITSTDVEF